jgi:predicted CXXCH cytochrome family protein
MRASARALAVALFPVLAAASLEAKIDPSAIDQRELCLACHDNIADETAASVSHPPAASGECSACHNPHAARNEHLLLERPAILCASCHADVGESLSLLHRLPCPTRWCT